jgi:hypothetical protein
VVVAPEWRGAGLGGALTDAAVAHLHGLGATTVQLLATDLGRPVYERLGFVAEGEYVTLAGNTATPGAGGPGSGSGGAAPRSAGCGPGGLRPGRAGDDLVAVARLDRWATGEDRGRLLGALWPDGGLVVDGSGGPRGFFLPSPWRPGGAAVAVDVPAGLTLLTAVAQASPDAPVHLPEGNRSGLAALAAAGFRERGRTTRMRLGPPVDWRPAALFGAHALFWG